MKTLNTTKRNSTSKDSEDFFETQDKTIDVLWDNYLKDFLLYSRNPYPSVIDFCCGKGAILNRLNTNLYKESFITHKKVKFIGSDLTVRKNNKNEYINVANVSIDMFDIDREDGSLIYSLFRNSSIPSEIHIVMNPPFNQLDKTMEYYLQLKKKYPNIKSLSLLHSVRALEGQRRHKILEEHGYPTLILNMTKRQSFNTYFGEEKREWTPPFSVCWSIWDDNYDGKTEFRYIKDRS